MNYRKEGDVNTYVWRDTDVPGLRKFLSELRGTAGERKFRTLISVLYGRGNVLKLPVVKGGIDFTYLSEVIRYNIVQRQSLRRWHNIAGLVEDDGLLVRCFLTCINNAFFRMRMFGA